MPELQNVSGLDIGQDLGFERRSWALQRVVWALIALGLCAAAAGLLGGAGPATGATAATADGGVEVRYDRVARLGASTSLAIELRGGEGTRNVALSRAWLEDYRLGGVVPEPDSVSALPDRYVFTFDAGDGGTARLSLTPQSIGRHRAVLWGPDGERVLFTQTVLP